MTDQSIPAIINQKNLDTNIYSNMESESKKQLFSINENTRSHSSLEINNAWSNFSAEVRKHAAKDPSWGLPIPNTTSLHI